MTSTDTIAERLTDLEVKFSFLQETVETLNETVTRQWQELDLIRKALEHVHDRVSEMEQVGGTDAPGQRPPHY